MNRPRNIASDQPGGPRRTALLLWAVSALVWMILVGWTLCDRVNTQVAASEAIAREIAALDCDGQASSPCGAAAAQPSDGSYGGTWTQTATLFVTYGFWQLATVTFVPPGMLLGIGVLASWTLRRRRGRFQQRATAVPAVAPLQAATRPAMVRRWLKAGA